MGLTAEPNKGDNGVHASASPFEGLAEKSNWLKKDPKDDQFGKRLLEAGISKKTMNAWFKDPQIKLSAESEMGSVFDSLEDMDAEECLQKMVDLNKLN